MENNITIGVSKSGINSNYHFHGDISYNPDTCKMMIYNGNNQTWTTIADNKSPMIITEDMLSSILKDHTKKLFNFLKIKNLNVTYEEFEDYLQSIQMADKLKNSGKRE